MGIEEYLENCGNKDLLSIKRKFNELGGADAFLDLN